MRIVFMGNAAFAVPGLTSVYTSAHELVSVVTNPDKKQGRNLRPAPTPVARFAGEHGIPLIQPGSLKHPSLASDLQGLKADLFVVVAFRILPVTLLRIPRLGCVNLHASLLPEYRGAAPIQWSLMSGDFLTGLTTFVLAPEVDTGDLLLDREVVIYPDDDHGSLARRMSYVGASLLMETVEGIESGKAASRPQNDSLATGAPRIRPDLCSIDWDLSAWQIHNKIRALSPVPGAYTVFRGKRIKLFRTALSWKRSGAPGEIVHMERESFVVSCGAGSLHLLEVQVEGKRRMSGRDFLLGSSLSPGEKLGS